MQLGKGLLVPAAREAVVATLSGGLKSAKMSWRLKMSSTAITHLSEQIREKVLIAFGAL